MSDTYWFDLVHLIHTSHSFAPLHIGAHRASQIACRINQLCERAGFDTVGFTIKMRIEFRVRIFDITRLISLGI